MKVLPNPSRRSKHHTQQSRFQGSLRQVRGQIIKELTNERSASRDELSLKITGDKLHFDTALNQLKNEGFIIVDANLSSVSLKS